MSSHMQSLLTRLRGVESQGKDADLADYLQNLMDERGTVSTNAPSSSSKKGNRKSMSSTAPSLRNKRTHRLDTISDLLSVTSKSSIDSMKSATGDDEVSVTTKIKQISKHTNLSKKQPNDEFSRSPLAVRVQEDTNGILRGGDSVDLSSETSKVLDNIEHMSLAAQEEATSNLIQDIVKSSQLLSSSMENDTGNYKDIGTGRLPPHLLAFKKGFDKLQKTKVKLPTITSMVDASHSAPSTYQGNKHIPSGNTQTSLRKKLSLLPPASEEELEHVEKIINDTTKIHRGEIYNSISTIAVKEKQQHYAEESKSRSKAINFQNRNDDKSVASCASTHLATDVEIEDDGPDIDEDALLDLYITDGTDIDKMTQDEKNEMLAKIRVQRKLEKDAVEAADRKRLANDERRKMEQQAETERLEREANKLLFKDTQFKLDKDENVILDRNSDNFFRHMENKKKEAVIKAAMQSRMAEEEAEAEAAAKRLFEQQKENQALRESNTETKEIVTESSSIKRDEHGNIVDSDSDEDDEDDYCDELPTVAVASTSPSQNGGARKQSIAQIMLKEESSLVKHGDVKDIMAEIKDMATPVIKKKTDRKMGISGKGDMTSTKMENNRTHTKFAAYQSPIFTDSRKIPPRSPDAMHRGVTDPTELLKPKKLIGGPLVKGTIEYGLPLGLQLQGSGRYAPLSMKDVAKFQGTLVGGQVRVQPKLGLSQLDKTPLKIGPAIIGDLPEVRMNPYESNKPPPSIPLKMSLSTKETKMIHELDEALFTGTNEYKDDKSLAEGVYSGTSKVTRSVAQSILSRYSTIETRYQKQKKKHDKLENESEDWMDDYKLGIHDELGVDIDAKFLGKKLAERAIRLMMFYILEVQLKNAFSLFRDQTRRVSNARIAKAAAIINRIGRGMVARSLIRLKKRMIWERNEREQSSKYKHIKVEMQASRVITRAIRLYSKMLIIKAKLRRRRASVLIQRRTRGITGRIRAQMRRDWVNWLHFNATTIQCCFRQHLARRKVALYSKILHVKGLMAQWEAIKKEKMKELQRAGAANIIRHYYRGYKIRAKLKTIIFWNRWEKAISLQRFTRGHAGRKIYKNLLRIKLAKEKRVFDAAQVMQKRIRGINARILFAQILLKKKKERARRRMAKAKYLEDKQNLFDKNNLKSAAIGTLRSLMPFRYILLWDRAVKIQRVFRGFKGRRKAFIRRVKKKIREYNAYYFGKEIGAKHLQRIFRGFKVRRGLVRELRLESAIKLQCFIRQFLARQCKTFHKVKQDAIQTLAKNIFLMLRFKKNMRNRKENKRVSVQTVMIQRMWRRALGRKRTADLKTFKRSEFERGNMIHLKINYLLSSIQLRILMESISREIGRNPPFIASGTDCPAKGPTQMLYLSAVGPKANTKPEGLLTNRLDNTSWSKWVQKLKGITANGKGLDTGPYMRQPILMKEWQVLLKKRNNRGKTPPTPAPSTPNKSTGRPNSRGRHKNGASNHEHEEEAVVYDYCSFSLLESVLDGTIQTAKGGKKQMSSNEVDMTFTKSKADPSHQTLNYFEFLQGCQILADIFFFDYKEEAEEAEAAEAMARAALQSKLQTNASVVSSLDGQSIEENEREEPKKKNKKATESSEAREKRKTKEKKRRARAKKKGIIIEEVNSSDDEDGGNNESDSDENAEEMSIEAKQALLEMQKKANEETINENLENGVTATKPKEVYGFTETTWKARSLLWNLNDIALTIPGKKMSDPLRPEMNLRVLMILKMFDSCRQEPWFIPVANWMEIEARSRLDMYCKRMQSMYWHMKAAIFRTLVRERKIAIAELAKRNNIVKVIQKYGRRMTAKMRCGKIAQAFLIKYIPDIGHPYWYNPSTKLTKLSKPAVLMHLECLSISMPPAGLEYVIKCSSCQFEQAIINCDECEDSYCRNCYDDLHCKGQRRNHHKLTIPMCSYCKYQMACRTCLTCITQKPEPGSPMELMNETQRGTMCDTCFTHSHNEHEIELQHASDSRKRALKNIFDKSKSAYLVAQQLHLSIKTSHKYLNLVQECEECRSRSALWRCLDCKQVYCNRCLLGLHSMGGPFAKHKGEKLPYYSPEMHQSYLEDQRTQNFQKRMEEVNKVWSIRMGELRMKSVVQLQSWWRMIRGRRVGLLHMMSVRKKQRHVYRERVAEEPIRKTWKFRVLQFIGYAPPLKSDTREERVLNRISIFGKHFARGYIWQNRDDFGHYKEITKTKNKVGQVVTKIKYARKGVPRAGFEVGTLEEQYKQALSGGYRLPGHVKVKKGESKLDTTCNLEELVKPGMLVKCGPGYFMVRGVNTDSITFDRSWRFAVPEPPLSDFESIKGPNRDPNRPLNINAYEDEANRTGNEAIYRLPVYSDEPNRYYYKFLYWGTNFVVSNPIAQMYFNMHQNVFNVVAGVGESMQSLYKKLGFLDGAKKWAAYARQQHARARWAKNLMNGDKIDIDLSELKKSGKSAKKKDKKIKAQKKSMKAKISPEIAIDSEGQPLLGEGITVSDGDNDAVHESGHEAAHKPKTTTKTTVAAKEEDDDDDLAAFMDDDIDYDDLQEEEEEEEGRKEGEKWVATKEEAAARKEAEDKMTREELASHADEWSEHVDPMTENVYWVHDETNEMQMTMPASLRMRILITEEEEKNKKDMDDAIARMQKSNGPGASKGKALFKKKR
jgi:hypothetical protein